MSSVESPASRIAAFAIAGAANLASVALMSGAPGAELPRIFNFFVRIHSSSPTQYCNRVAAAFTGAKFRRRSPVPVAQCEKEERIVHEFRNAGSPHVYVGNGVLRSPARSRSRGNHLLRIQ